MKQEQNLFFKVLFFKKMLALNRLMAELLSIQSICNSYETKFIVDCFTVLFQVLNICFTKCTLSTCSLNTINVPAGQFYC